MPEQVNEVFIRYPYNQKLGSSLTASMRPNTVYGIRIKPMAHLLEQRDGAFIVLDIHAKNNQDLDSVKEQLGDFYPEESFSHRFFEGVRQTPLELIYNQIIRPGIILAIICLAYLFYEIGQTWPIFKSKLLHGFSIPRIVMEQYNRTSLVSSFIIFASYYAGLQYRRDEVFKLSRIAALHALLLALFILAVFMLFMVVMRFVLILYSHSLQGRKTKTNTVPVAILVYIVFAALLLPSISSNIGESRRWQGIIQRNYDYMEGLERNEVSLFTLSAPQLGAIREGESLSTTEIQDLKAFFEDNGIYFNNLSISEDSELISEESGAVKIQINRNYLAYFFPEIAYDYNVGDVISSEDVNLGPIINLNPTTTFLFDQFENYKFELVDMNDLFVNRVDRTAKSPLNSPYLFFSEEKIPLIREKLQTMVANYGYDDVVIVSLEDIIEQELILLEESVLQSVIFSAFILLAIMLIYILVILSFLAYFENRLAIERVHGFSIFSSYWYMGLISFLTNAALTAFLWFDGYQYFGLDYQMTPYYYEKEQVIFLMVALTFVELGTLAAIAWWNEKRLLTVLKGKTVNEVQL